MDTIKSVATLAFLVLVVGLAAGVIFGFVDIGSSGTTSGRAGPSLPKSDTPPVEFIYLDAARVSAYLGQAEGGLAATETRTEQLTQSVNSSLSAGSVAQIAASRQAQQSTQATVSPTAADLFYTFLRLMRERGEVLGYGGSCNPPHPAQTDRWVGSVDAFTTNVPGGVANRLRCIGEGNFVRLYNAHLYLPIYAAALPAAQNAAVFRGEFRTPRVPFTAPTIKRAGRRALRRYAASVGRNPRLPFVLSLKQGGQTIRFFVPARYRGLTREGSLFSGNVTVVGKIVDMNLPSAGAARAGNLPSEYVDTPTVATFGRALLHAPKAFLAALGVCAPPGAHTRRHGLSRPAPHCTSQTATLRHITDSVTFRAPFVVILPLAIYQ